MTTKTSCSWQPNETNLPFLLLPCQWSWWATTNGLSGSYIPHSGKLESTCFFVSLYWNIISTFSFTLLYVFYINYTQKFSTKLCVFSTEMFCLWFWHCSKSGVLSQREFKSLAWWVFKPSYSSHQKSIIVYFFLTRHLLLTISVFCKYD